MTWFIKAPLQQIQNINFMVFASVDDSNKKDEDNTQEKQAVNDTGLVEEKQDNNSQTNQMDALLKDPNSYFRYFMMSLFMKGNLVKFLQYISYINNNGLSNDIIDQLIYEFFESTLNTLSIDYMDKTDMNSFGKLIGTVVKKIEEVCEKIEKETKIKFATFLENQQITDTMFLPVDITGKTKKLALKVLLNIKKQDMLFTNRSNIFDSNNTIMLTILSRLFNLNIDDISDVSNGNRNISILLSNTLQKTKCDSLSQISAVPIKFYLMSRSDFLKHKDTLAKNGLGAIDKKQSIFSFNLPIMNNSGDDKFKSFFEYMHSQCKMAIGSKLESIGVNTTLLKFPLHLKYINNNDYYYLPVVFTTNKEQILLIEFNVKEIIKNQSVNPEITKLCKIFSDKQSAFIKNLGISINKKQIKQLKTKYVKNPQQTLYNFGGYRTPEFKKLNHEILLQSFLPMSGAMDINKIKNPFEITDINQEDLYILLEQIINSNVSEYINRLKHMLLVTYNKDLQKVFNFRN